MIYAHGAHLPAYTGHGVRTCWPASTSTLLQKRHVLPSCEITRAHT
jgi:hypothetical protein